MNHTLFMIDAKTIIVLVVLAVGVSATAMVFLLAFIVDFCVWLRRKASRVFRRGN
jgi:hypothetical protein